MYDDVRALEDAEPRIFRVPKFLTEEISLNTLPQQLDESHEEELAWGVEDHSIADQTVLPRQGSSRCE